MQARGSVGISGKGGGGKVGMQTTDMVPGPSWLASFIAQAEEDDGLQRELARFKLSRVEKKAILLLSLFGPYALSDTQVGGACSKSLSWIATKRRTQTFSSALAFIGRSIAYSHFPRIIGQAVFLAEKGDQKMIRFVLEHFSPDETMSLGDFKSQFGEEASKLGSEVIEELTLTARRIKPGHHK